MPRSLKLYIAGLVIISAAALLITSLLFPADDRIALQIGNPRATTPLELALGIGFWVVVTLFASALPVQMPGGILVAVAIAPCIAAMNLGGPAVGAWVALLGTTEIREVRGRIPWYGTLANHAGIVLPAVGGGVVMEGLWGRG